jgi:ATP-dependent phosphofructokinase / diphosphate-dependent phosphofructokinase
MTRPKRIGVLTGGGDAPGLNAVLRAVVRTAERAYGAEVIGVLDGFAGLLESRFRPLTGSDVRELIRMGGTVLGTTNRDNPFACPGEHGPVDRSVEVVENARRIGLDAVIVIGGDGTLRIASELGRLGMNVVGVPKTIDNDLASTDYTFGFWTAIGVATEALDRLRDTAESHHRVMLLEVMGRNAGWIALHAGIAGAADVILIPEIPYLPESVAATVVSCQGRGRASSLVVVAEGAMAQGGEVSVVSVDATTGVVRLGGAGERVVRELEALTRCDVRATVLGHLQRGGSPVAFDRILATQFGEAATHLVMERRFGRMVRLSAGRIEDVDLVEAVRETKRVDPQGALVKTARSLGIAFGDEPV